MTGAGNRKLNLISWNVKGLNHPVKRNRVLAHLSQLHVGIAFLQETHFHNADINRIRRTWVGEVFHSRFNSKARCTAILIHKDILFAAEKTVADPGGRFVIVSGKLLNKPVILANIYAPNWDNEAFIKSFFSALPEVNVHNLIIGGDFNCVLSPELYSSTAKRGPLSKTA